VLGPRHSKRVARILHWVGTGTKGALSFEARVSNAERGREWGAYIPSPAD